MAPYRPMLARMIAGELEPLDATAREYARRWWDEEHGAGVAIGADLPEALGMTDGEWWDWSQGKTTIAAIVNRRREQK